MSARKTCPAAMAMLLLLLAAGPGLAGSIRVVVDPRVELVSTVFYLAGVREYGMGRVPGWTAAVDEHFRPHAEHEVVRLAKRLHEEHGIGYNAPMALAAHLKDDGGFAPRAPLDPRPEGLDERWTPEDAAAFVAALQDFARASDFAAFWAVHAEETAATAARLAAIVREHDIPAWCNELFGQAPGADFVLAAAMLNGPPNYGVSARLPSGDELWCVLGVWHTDEAGRPSFTAEVLPTVVHEFLHSYVNPLVDEHWAALAPGAEGLFRQVAEPMSAQAYGEARIVLYESLVRAASVRWVQANVPGTTAAQAAAEDHGRGFIWVGELSELLGTYEARRDRYPDLAAFVPELAAFLEAWAEKVGPEQARLEAARKQEMARLAAAGPAVVSTEPADGAAGLEPGPAIITIVFDRPMAPPIALMTLPDCEFPAVAGKPAFDAGGTRLTLPVTLAPGRRYGYSLNSESRLAMRDRDGNPLAPVAVRFSTGAGAEGGRE